jgi:hypothetical protein
MSCLIDLKIVSLMGDKTDDCICEHLMEQNDSFLSGIVRKFTIRIKKFAGKYLFRQVVGKYL